MTQYRTLLIDPPWLELGGGKIKRGADRHYDLMKTSEIIEYLTSVLKDRIYRNCHCYLWVTNNFLPDGLLVLEALGFRYVTNLVWVKDKFGLGYYFRGKHELCLFGVRGDCKPNHKIFEGNLRSGAKQKPFTPVPTTVIKERTRKHSQKPRKIYSLIETVSQPPRLELFARERRVNWDVLGNEAPSSTQFTLTEGSLIEL